MTFILCIPDAAVGEAEAGGRSSSSAGVHLRPQVCGQEPAALGRLRAYSGAPRRTAEAADVLLIALQPRLLS